MGEECERLRIGHYRYEKVRRMTAQQFAAACEVNIRMGKPFDEIIDDLRPYGLTPNAPVEGPPSGAELDTKG
jgi:hypothetical protein